MANIIQAFPKGAGSGGGGAIFSYIDATKTALDADWLKDKENNTLEPKEGLLYLILSAGEYYNSFYRFNETTSKYVLVQDASGAGAIFSYIDSTKTALDADWLKDENNTTITPKEGPLYLILTVGEYYNSLYRFDETTDKYVLVQSADGGVVFATIDSTKTALDPDWLKSTYNVTLTPKEGLLYLILTDGEYKNNFYRFNTTTNKYVLVQKCIQLSTMPTASADNEGVIVQYTGATTSTYTHGYFYESVSNGSGGYEWAESTTESPEIIEISQHDFELLPTSEKNNGKTYFINDANMSNYYSVKAGCTPIGTIISVTGTTAPEHYLLCDGTVYNIETYPKLADYFEDQFGSKNIFGGDGMTTFAVPDMNQSTGSTPIITLIPSNVSPIFCIAYDDVYVEPLLQYSPFEKMTGTWEDGLPKYQISISGTTINTTEGEINTGLSGIIYAELERFQVSNGTYIKNLLDSVAIKQDGTKIAMVADATSLFKNQTFYATINYKKQVPSV